VIPYGRQSISEEDIEGVVAVLRSDFITQGPAIERFETAVAEYCGVEHAVAVCNGTAALHAACLALGLEPGKKLWTSPITFVASANAGRYCGADIDFVDIDPATYNMSVEALREKLRAEGPPDVLVPVHFAGASCDMAEIAELSEKHGFAVLEDASHAIGASYQDEPVGSCRYSNAATFSFHPVKIITTGEGGMAVTNDAELANRCRMLRTHGITRDPDRMQAEPEGPWYYEQQQLGYNFRMTDIQAALGASQMQRIDEFVARRNELAERYKALLAGLPVSWQHVHTDTRSAYHLFVIELAEETPPRAEVFAALRESGVGANVHYIPVHLQPYYRALGFEPGDFPNAEAYYERAITLPLYPAMADEDLETVVSALREALGA